MIGIAIVGTGAIAAIHIRALAKFKERAAILALCDLYPDKAEILAKEEGLSVSVYRDYQEALERTDIDLISICLPPALHARVAIDALKAGKHVLVEKPMAGSLEECDQMIEAARESGKLLSVVAQNRYQDPVVRIKSIIDSGKAGRVLFSQINSLWWRGESYYDLWWRGTWEKDGGGCTLSHAVHHIDMLCWILGMPLEVSAHMSNVNHHNSEMEDISLSIFKYPRASLAQLTTSLISHGEEQELIFQTEEAKLSIPWKISSFREQENGFPQENNQKMEKFQQMYDGVPPLLYQGHEGQMNNMINAIEGKEKLMVDGVEGRRSLELIMGIYSSATKGKSVTFPISSDDPIYKKGSMAAMMPKYHTKKKSIDNFNETKISLGRIM
jgi:UDP-N-acetyl-2-amino-2-deoxyglucuronate dehydrogenase